MLGVVMQEGWNGLDLGEALEAETEEDHRRKPAARRQLHQGHGSGGQYPPSRRRVHAQVLHGARRGAWWSSLISLGWRVGIVVAAAVPLTLAVVFVIMLDTGRVFDRITLGALILALGLLVDDAIIAIEMMVVKMEEGMDRIKAAAYAWSHTAAPMLSGTLVTVIGLMPGRLRPVERGEYAGNIFWIVGFALIASWFVAVVFTPVPRREDAARRSSRSRAVTPRSTPRPTTGGCAASGRLVGPPQVPRRRRRGRRVRDSPASAWVPVKQQFFPTLGPSRGAGRGADAGRQQHRGDQRRRGQGRRLAEAAAGSADRHQLYRPGRAPLLPRPTTRNCPIRPSPRSSS